MSSLPQTDLHKLIGYFAGVLIAALARYGAEMPLEIAIIILNGVILLVSTLVGKKTNPTGANSSEARKALEESTGVTKEYRAPDPATRRHPAGADPDQDANGRL
jgi:hypothetical protein